MLQVSLVSIGVLNLLLGIAELLPGYRARLAGILRVAAYLSFLGGLMIIGSMLLAASG